MKTNKSKLTLAFALISLGIIILATMSISKVFVSSKTNNIMNKNQCITDKKPLEKYFPSFGIIIECYWDTGNLHHNLFNELTNIGPSEYWVNGYAKVDSDAIERLMETYCWQKVSIGSDNNAYKIIIQLYSDEQQNDAQYNWHTSDEFDVSFGGFYGDFYFDPNNQIIVFNLVKN